VAEQTALFRRGGRRSHSDEALLCAHPVSGRTLYATNAHITCDVSVLHATSLTCG
jgi:hypothetical protein